VLKFKGVKQQGELNMMEKQNDNSNEKAGSKKSPWPSAKEAMGMIIKLANDVKKSGEEIYADYKSKREGTNNASDEKSKHDNE
jgi:hypothetical protein